MFWRLAHHWLNNLPSGRRPIALALAFILVSSSGCTCCRTLYCNMLTPERLNNGYTIILPGIEGAEVVQGCMARGLESGGVDSAIEIYDWTTGVPPLMPLHLRWLSRNRREASAIAAKIVDYQDRYPGKPVHLIGHSAGGAMCLLAIEELPADRKVTGAILLAAAISPRYPLDPALSKTQVGIWNYYSPLDAPLCMLGTTLLGTVDGVHSPAAGAIGFVRDDDDHREDNAGPRLEQIPYRPRMLLSLNWGGHFGWCSRAFARNYLAPVVLASAARTATEPEPLVGAAGNHASSMPLR